jgi:hypothetical protein
LHDAFLPFVLFNDHCALLELGYPKSGKIAYPELVRYRTFRINNLLLCMKTIMLKGHLNFKFFKHLLNSVMRYDVQYICGYSPTGLVGFSGSVMNSSLCVHMGRLLAV